jgi:hypothetical protein
MGLDGGRLAQVQAGQKRVTTHYSKTLSKAERYYCVTRLVRALEHIHKYGQEFQ